MSLLDALIYGVRDVLNSLAPVSRRSRLNFGTGLTVTEDPINDVNTVTATGGTSGIVVQEEGVPLATNCTTFNFVGPQQTVSGAGALKTFGSNPTNLAGGGTWITGLLPIANLATPNFGAQTVTCGLLFVSSGIVSPSVDAFGALALGNTSSTFQTLGRAGTTCTVPGVLACTDHIEFGTPPGISSGAVRFGFQGGIQDLISGAYTAGASTRVLSINGAAAYVTMGDVNNWNVAIDCINRVDSCLTSHALNSPSSTKRTFAGLLAFTFTHSSTAPKLEFATTATTATIRQADNTTNGATASPLKVQAANATGTTSVGAILDLKSGTGTTRHGDIDAKSPIVLGFFTQAMGGADQTVSPTDSANNIFLTTGNNGAALRTLTISCAATPGAMKVVRNNCTGAGNTAVKFLTGTSVTILNGLSALITADGAGNAFIVMSGT